MDILDHPTIAVPTKGTYVVRFGLGAQYTLEKEHHVSMEEVGRRLQDASPRIGSADCMACAGTGEPLQIVNDHGIPIKTIEQSGVPVKCSACAGSGKQTTPGRISPAFLFDVLSACIWGQIQLSPRDLAECYDSFDQLSEVARVVMIAFTKTRWSASNAPTSATATGQDPKVVQ